MARLFVTSLIAAQRRFLLFVAHLGLAALSNWLAFLLRFDEDIPAQQWDLFASLLPLLLTIRALTFYPFQIYGGLWCARLGDWGRGIDRLGVVPAGSPIVSRSVGPIGSV